MTTLEELEAEVAAARAVRDDRVRDERARMAEFQRELDAQRNEDHIAAVAAVKDAAVAASEERAAQQGNAEAKRMTKLQAELAELRGEAVPDNVVVEEEMPPVEAEITPPDPDVDDDDLVGDDD